MIMHVKVNGKIMADKILQTLDSIKELVNRIQFADWEFHIKEHKGAPYFQISFEAIDNTDRDISETQWCRKWSLQYVMCDGEIVRTVYKAVQTAILHEMDEQFKFDGEMIYSPHTNPHELVKLRRGQLADDLRESS